MYNLYLTFIEFQSNYSDDLKVYLNSYELFNESDFKDFLIEKYKEQIEELETISQEQFKGHYNWVLTMKLLQPNKHKETEHSEKLYKLCLGDNNEYNDAIQKKLRTEIKSILNELGYKAKPKKVSNKKDRTFKGLFMDDELYDEVINLLIKNERFDGNKNKIKADAGKEKITIIALMYVLKKRHYFKQSDKAEMCRVSSLFFKEPITKPHFNKTFNSMNDDINPYENFIKEFYFIRTP